MDRREVYAGQVLPETVLLNMAKDAMIGIAKLTSATLGTSTLLHNLACVPDSPASLNVSVGPGQIYSLQNIDDTAFSSLVADTTHTIVKQGIRLDSSLLSCPAPGTGGQSINYLIQVKYTDTDSGSTVLPYYNASNPASAWSGPANSGAAQNTVRQGVCTVAVKPGTAAATGTQTTPSADAGYVGAWVVTVDNGETTIVSGDIALASGAPFITESLTQKISQATADALYAPLSAIGYKGYAGLHVVTGTTTLTNADFGKLILMSGSGYTVTLPSAASGSSGYRLAFESTGTNITLARAGSDVMQMNSANARTSVVFNDGDTLAMATNGGVQWEVGGGSLQLKYAPEFAASLGSSGWRTLPDGSIEQWGTTGSIANGGANVVTFPIAFPTSCDWVSLPPVAPSPAYTPYGDTYTTTSFTARNATGGAATCNYRAIGR